MNPILVTGSTDGLGRRVAERLAERGDAVLVHGRDPGKLERVAREVGAAGAYLADLASLDEVRRMADEGARDHGRLGALVNNAGIVARERRESKDGYELGFAVNHLAHFLLTMRLLPRLGRIVNVSSAGQSAIDFDDVMLERGYGPMRSYRQSKLAQVMFTFELAERAPEGVTVNALHPATFMDTKMVREGGTTPISSVEEGAEAVLHVLDLDGVSGRYFNGEHESRADEQAYDERARRRLWELSERLTGTAGPAY
jgi:NAD(P)-dependent dehydrogenase (short-subunit alcohol dehydrogenase family)